jgi:transposase
MFRVREAGMGWGAAVRIELSDGERSELRARARGRKIARADAMRAAIVLAADGMTNLAIAERLGIARVTVALWRKRFAAKRLDGLVDEPRPGAPRKIGDDKIAEVVTTTLETMPAAATHWSTRGMAKATGVSTSTVHRIWRAFSLQPHRSETFKPSTDPLFLEKVRDIVGLYLDPPDRALVLCVDEKSQIQALDRTQPMLPMRPGQAERQCLQPQDQADPRLVRQTAPLAHPLHADLRVLDQPGRAVLRAPRRAADQARRAPLHQGAGGGHRRPYRRPQCRPQALPLDQDRRRYPRIHRTVLPPHPRRPSSMWIETSESGH